MLRLLPTCGLTGGGGHRGAQSIVLLLVPEQILERLGMRLAQRLEFLRHVLREMLLLGLELRAPFLGQLDADAEVVDLALAKCEDLLRVREALRRRRRQLRELRDGDVALALQRLVLPVELRRMRLDVRQPTLRRDQILTILL